MIINVTGPFGMGGVVIREILLHYLAVGGRYTNSDELFNCVEPGMHERTHTHVQMHVPACTIKESQPE